MRKKISALSLLTLIAFSVPSVAEAHHGFGRAFLGGMLGGAVGGVIGGAVIGNNGGFGGYNNYGYNRFNTYGGGYGFGGYQPPVVVVPPPPVIMAPPPPPPTYFINCSYDMYGNQICTRQVQQSYGQPYYGGY